MAVFLLSMRFTGRMIIDDPYPGRLKFLLLIHGWQAGDSRSSKQG
jgi:hypothetical protein